MHKYFCLFFFLLCCSSCTEPEEESTNLLDTSEYNFDVEVARDVETIYSDEGKVKVQVLSPSLVRHKARKDPYTEFPDGVNVTFFNDKLKKTSTLTAKYAIRQEKDYKVTMQDSVVVITVNEDKIETDELIWNEKKERITSDKFVKITTENEEIQGMGFWANQDFSEYEIDSITGFFKVKKDKFDK